MAWRQRVITDFLRAKKALKVHAVHQRFHRQSKIQVVRHWAKKIVVIQGAKNLIILHLKYWHFLKWKVRRQHQPHHQTVPNMRTDHLLEFHHLLKIIQVVIPKESQRIFLKKTFLMLFRKEILKVLNFVLRMESK